ncbi:MULTISPECIES: hypothetical protein [unclassified Pseudomonas]|uniref:hypothetical protein n=1 Tax=unclassified Pseudomonas TaxID=196821 RepID=UPI0038009615
MNAITETSPATSSRLSAPLNVKVTNALRVNADQEQVLHPSYIIARGRVPISPTPASNASFQTVVEGGTPSYAYSSNNLAVAVVSTTGKVVAAGIGSAIITVTDDKGRTASYTITFKGTMRLVEQGRAVPWSSDSQDRNRPEYYALTREQMRWFWEQYKDEDLSRSVPAILGWASNTNYWSGDNDLSGAVAWAVNFSALAPNFAGTSTGGGVLLPTVTKISW